jgi:hypothetical protein
MGSEFCSNSLLTKGLRFSAVRNTGTLDSESYRLPPFALPVLPIACMKPSDVQRPLVRN